MLRYLLFVLILLDGFGLAIAQVHDFDSLYRAANTTNVDSLRVILLNDASVALREADTKRALEIAEEARKLAGKINFVHGRAMVLANIGWINYRKGVYSEALLLSNEALKIHRQLGDMQGIVNCLNNIGAVSFEQRKYDVALKSFKDAYSTAKQVRYTVGMSRSLNNISFCFLLLKQLDSARFYTLRSINENVNDKNRTSFSNRQLGDIAFEEGNYVDALGHYQECLKGATEQNNNFILASTQYRAAKTLLKLGHADKALELVKKNVELAKKYNYKSELEATYLTASKVYEAKRDMARAMEYLSLHYQLKDSLSEQRRGELIFMVERQSEAEIKNSQIELLTKSAQLKEKELRLQRVLLYVGIIGLLILLSVVVLLVRQNRRSVAVNKILAEKNIFINEQAQQLVALNSTKDKLFSIIGHDLRSPLNNLRGMIDLLRKSLITQDEFVAFSNKIRTSVDYVYADLENLLSWAQSQQKGLSPRIERLPLYPLIMDKVNLLAENSSVKKLSIQVNVDQELFVRADRNQLGLIVRNLLSNAIKFSFEGGMIFIEATKKENQVEILVHDQGVGIDAEAMEKLFRAGTNFSTPGTGNEKGIGLGLLLVKEFVELNQGTIHASSKVGEGATFTFSLPASA